jgi:hypothetical protein
MFGTHNIALSGNDIYTISSPNFISYIFDKEYLKIYFHNTLQSLSNREHVIFQHSIENIYDQPLFYNPEILHCGKIIKFLSISHNTLVIHITFLQPSHTIVLLYII